MTKVVREYVQNFSIVVGIIIIVVEERSDLSLEPLLEIKGVKPLDLRLIGIVIIFHHSTCSIELACAKINWVPILSLDLHQLEFKRASLYLFNWIFAECIHHPQDEVDYRINVIKYFSESFLQDRSWDSNQIRGNEFVFGIICSIRYEFFYEVLPLFIFDVFATTDQIHLQEQLFKVSSDEFLLHLVKSFFLEVHFNVIPVNLHLFLRAIQSFHETQVEPLDDLVLVDLSLDSTHE